jgi:hypothetical protein
MANAWKCAYCANMNSNIEVACPECGLPRPALSTRLLQAFKENWKTVAIVAIFSLTVVFIISSCASAGLFKSSGQAGDSNKNKSAVLSMVQNWKPPQNNGMTCGQAYDALVDVYQSSLGIADAEVVWSVDDPVGKSYLVHAALKGETGWANYRWKVNPTTNSIASLDQLSICPYSP